MKPIIAVPAIFALVYRAWSRKSLTPLGLVLAAVTAIAHAIHPWSVFFTLLGVFFLTGTTVTKVKHDVKAKLTLSSSGTPGSEGPRNHIQVLANSLVASILIPIHAWALAQPSARSQMASPSECWDKGTWNDVIVVGIVANYAAVAADTFSSELGILSKSRPRLITAPWRVVAPGTNGGVTSTGLLAGLLGSFIISGTSALLLPFCPDPLFRKTSLGSNIQGWTLSEKMYFTIAMTLVGLSGSLLDSLLGAVLQASVVDNHTGKVIEGEGGRKVLVHAEGSLNTNTATKVRSTMIEHKEGSGAVAKSSAISGQKERAQAKARVGDKKEHNSPTSSLAESRRVESGLDILDNNGVNFLMAVLVSIGAMGGAAFIWELYPQI